MYNYDVLGVLPVIAFFLKDSFYYFINMIASHCCFDGPLYTVEDQAKLNTA